MNETYWEPRIQRVQVAWAIVERASVGQFRQACQQNVDAKLFPSLVAKAVEMGRGLLVLEQKPSSYDFVLATDIISARAFAAAFRNRDHEMMGDLLGYPPCCIRAFTQEPTRIDTFDTRFVPHIPCSSFCIGTKALARVFRKLMDEAFPREADWLEELPSYVGVA